MFATGQIERPDGRIVADAVHVWGGSGGAPHELAWWHAPSDANAPMSAALRLVDSLPNARMEWFGENEGHMAHYHREGEILDELLSRG